MLSPHLSLGLPATDPRCSSHSTHSPAWSCSCNIWQATFVQEGFMHFMTLLLSLLQIADASVVDLDCWRLRLTLPDSSYKPAKTYAMAEVARDEAAAVRASRQVLTEGIFYNYFSVGADAQAAYNFHHLRDEHPMLASNRLANQFWYSAFSCTSGDTSHSITQTVLPHSEAAASA